MKICYVANSRFPSERAHMTHIVQMCNAFSHLGHEVTLLVTDRKTDITESPEEFFGIPLVFSVVRIPVPDIAGRSPQIPPILRPYVFMLQRVVFSYRALLHIRRHTYTHLYGRDEWILWFLTHLVKQPIIWESHEAKFSFIARKLLRVLSRVVVISEGIYDFYINQEVPSEKILVAHDAVDDRFFETHISTEQARAILNMKPQKPVVMYIGGLETWKGGITFFEAAKDQDIFEAYVVGGNGTELPLFREQYPQVHFLGSRPYRELPQLQQAADILVIPNTAHVPLSAHYTSPLKLFAYMTSRKPIVASRIPSITNVLNDTEAFFFAADDREDLKQVIIDVLQHEGLAQEKSERAYQKSMHYTWQKRAVSILKFLMGSYN